MRKKVLKRKNDMSATARNIIGIIISSVIGAVICLILTLVFSYVFANAEVLTNSVSAIFIACIMLGGFFCGALSSRLTAFKGIVSGILTSILYSLIITVIMLFFSDGRLSGNALFLYIGIIIVGIIGGICGANIKRRK